LRTLVNSDDKLQTGIKDAVHGYNIQQFIVAKLDNQLVGDLPLAFCANVHPTGARVKARRTRRKHILQPAAQSVLVSHHAAAGCLLMTAHTASLITFAKYRAHAATNTNV
jgi:hypothetical protein